MQNVNFFKKQGGRWFSQRTTHYLKTGGSKAGKSDLEITYFDENDDTVVRLCGEAHWPAADAVGGLRIVQKSTIIGGKTRNQSTLLVAIATDDKSGKLLSQPEGQPISQLSQYRFENDVLTITTDANGLRAEERWWFITDKLRMRTHVLSDKEGQTMASFCSEIRLGDVSA
ncbi:homodimeric phycobilin -iii family [Leptolyngbya sp. Heron Island J]|uniref:phycobiliprotein lyase n=1 Tax=Leptolyngbya sp. Heron Island J TaxID=1385935 RepID=UPI0003B96447|nr:phycobiliprotein lyase [Leptolyngbya sp. Heron Island J]ESA37801.1 homodimeric phycobilin -iii family [Leptolyngbya sp. Heron Island J]